MSNKKPAPKPEKPVNNKPSFVDDRGRVKRPEFASNNFTLNPIIQNHLEERGLVPRYVNMKEMKNRGGTNSKGWVPYQVDDELQKKLTGGFTVTDADGYIRRGDLVLAVKKKEDAEHHRAWLAQEAKENSVQYLQKRKTQEVRDKIRDLGLDKYVTVDDNYEFDPRAKSL